MERIRRTTIVITDKEHDRTLSDGDLEGMLRDFYELYLLPSCSYGKGLRSPTIQITFEIEEEGA